MRGPQTPDPASDVMGGPEPPDDVIRGPQTPDPASDVMGGPRPKGWTRVRVSQPGLIRRR